MATHIDTLEHEVQQLREEVRHLREDREPGEDRDPERNGSDRPDQEEKDQDEKKKPPHPARKWILIAAVVVVAIAGFFWWLHARKFENTDDAQVDGHISGVAARIAGTVTGVYVEENQWVEAGQVIADLDPQDYKVAAELAQSQLTQARAQTQAQQPNVPVTQVTTETTIATADQEVLNAAAGVAAADQNYQAALAKVRESTANSAKAQTDVERYRPLVEKDEVPREQFDALVANATALAAAVAASQASAEAARQQADQSRAQLAQARQRAEQARKNAPREVDIRRANVAASQAAAQTASAQLDQARLNLSYTQIRAPVKGIVAKRTAEVGERVSPGQQLALITQVDDLWVTADFKENQLRRIRPGQKVRVHVDALDRDFDAYVEAMPAASGAVTSLLPPENATGNFVKVVQRLPVRIRFQKGQDGLDQLRPGMSVEPKISVE